MKPSAPARPSPGSPSEVDLLRHIAREEPLTDTVRAFRGLTRERLGQILEQLADSLSGPARDAPVVAAAAAPIHRLRLYSDGAARGSASTGGGGPP